MLNLGERGDEEARRAGIRRVRAWTEQRLGREADGATVFVAELACAEPGCPPRETVIVISYAGRRTQHRVHAPAADVTEEQVAALLSGASRCESGADHPHPEESP